MLLYNKITLKKTFGYFEPPHPINLRFQKKRNVPPDFKVTKRGGFTVSITFIYKIELEGCT